MVRHAELGEYMLALVGVGATQGRALNACCELLAQPPPVDKEIRDGVFRFSAAIATLLATAGRLQKFSSMPRLWCRWRALH